MADNSRGVDLVDPEEIIRGRPPRVLADSMQTIVREYVREANREGSYVTLEMLCRHLESVDSEQEFSIRTLGRALDRWGFTFGKGIRSQRLNVKNQIGRSCDFTMANLLTQLEKAFESVTDKTCLGLIKKFVRWKTNFGMKISRKTTHPSIKSYDLNYSVHA